MGRTRSIAWSFGHPILDSDGTHIGGEPHDEPWRGYEYDERGALTKVWEDAGIDGTGVDHSTLTAQNNEISNIDVDNLGSSQTNALGWDYQREPDIGSLVAITEPNSGEDRWRTSSTSTTTTRDDGHRLDLVEVDQASHQIQHDDSGAVTEAFGYTFTYGPSGRLIQVGDANGLVEAYAYDADGRLAAVFDDLGLRESYAYDGEQMIAAYGAQEGPLWEAVWGAKLDQLIAFYDFGDDRTYLPLADHRNSIAGTWSADDGRMDAIAEYSPHGRMKLYDADETPDCPAAGSADEYCLDASQRPSGMPFGFVSAWTSPETGLVYMRNRWYSPRLAQFLSHDPMGYVDSYNPYAYVGFDPINGWDPFGLEDLGDSEALWFADLNAGQPRDSYPDEVQLPPSIHWKLRELNYDNHVPTSLRGRASATTMERAAIITRSGELFSLSKKEHADLTNGDISKHSPNPETVLKYLAETREGFDEGDAAVYVHTHPTGDAPSRADIANNTLAGQTPIVDMTIGDDIYLLLPTEETAELRDRFSDESELYRRTKQANLEGRQVDQFLPGEEPSDLLKRAGENGLKAATKESEQVLYKLNYSRNPASFTRVKTKKSFAE